MTEASTTLSEGIGVDEEVDFVDDDDEDEILVEPRFRYTRLLGNLVRSLDVDSASAFAIHDKFLAVGFQSGRICFYDHMGNETLHSSSRYHKCAVSSLSIDRPGNYLISCANDFTVNIFGIGSTEFNQRLSLQYSAKVVEIAADFSRLGSNQRFLANVARLNETGTRIYDLKLGRSLTLIQPFHMTGDHPSNCSPNLTWLDESTIAIGWANSVCVCSIQTGLRRYSNSGGPALELPVKHGQILHKFTIPAFFIAGLSFTLPSADDLYDQKLIQTVPPNSSPNSIKNIQTNETKCELVIFGVRDNQQHTSDEEHPSEEVRSKPFSAQLLLLRPVSVQDYLLVSEDTIEMRNVDLNLLHRFTLCSLTSDDIFFLMGAREVIEAIPCSLDERIFWLMDNGLFEEAWERAIRNSELLRENSVLEVGKRLVNHLIETKSYDLAANFLPQVCLTHKVEWEFYVNEFERHHQILKLVPIMPTKEPQLEPECYESVLLAALYMRPKLFDAIVSHWNADIYRAHSIRDKVFDRIATDNRSRQLKKLGGKESLAVKLLREDDRGYILHALANLYLQLQDYENAIKTFLLLGDPAIFGIINRHKLFSYIVKKGENSDDEAQTKQQQNYIKQLMEINQTLAIRLLLDNEDLLPHDEVVKLLGHDPKIQMNYLLLLQTRGEGVKYSDRLVKLLAEHKRESLLSFLRKNENYKLDVALEVCKRRDYVEEMVYLLGRSGNRLEALDLMVNKMYNIDMAIDFCAENGDSELWQRLIQFATNRPEHVACLLRKTASVNINPLDIIEKV
uniref:Vacuolar protein sorting-associated protein 41 homolog n=1 Tax=Globodera rostochiensis TaxID=31243 RepID=A0A914GZH7_GLORO